MKNTAMMRCAQAILWLVAAAAAQAKLIEEQFDLPVKVTDAG